jgi:DNA mismatch repair protein MSH6
MSLPSGCVWTGLRPVEGFKYEETLTELKKIYCTAEDIDMEDEDSPYALPESVPESIREMARDKLAIEALGSMVWYVKFPLSAKKWCLTS